MIPLGIRGGDGAAEAVAMRRSLPLLLAMLLAGCGGGGSETNTAPTIATLSFAPSAVYVGAPGSTTEVGGHFEFADAEGNLDTLTLVILDAGGATLSSTTYDIDIAGKPKSGTIDGVFTVGTAVLGTYTFRLYVTDRKGLSSNALQGLFRVAEFPWVARTAMPAKRRDFATATLGGLIYLIGGGDTLAGITPAPATATLQVFEPVTGTWTNGPAMPWAVTDHVAVAVGAEIIVIGQVYDSGSKCRVQRFDPGTQTWSLGADGPLARTQAAAAVLGGKVYLMGGTEGGFDLASMDVYDPGSDSWSSGAALASPRRSLAAATVDGKLLALGGYTSMFIADGGYRRAVESFDPLGAAWSAAPDMLDARSDQAVAVIGSQLFSAGGGNVARALADLMMFDAGTGMWTPKTAMPVAMGWPRAEAVGGKVYVFDTDATLEYTPGNDIL